MTLKYRRMVDFSRLSDFAKSLMIPSAMSLAAPYGQLGFGGVSSVSGRISWSPYTAQLEEYTSCVHNKFRRGWGREKKAERAERATPLPQGVR